MQRKGFCSRGRDFSGPCFASMTNTIFAENAGLSATVHSGGERSLTTFLYMLSLQTLSKVRLHLKANFLRSNVLQQRKYKGPFSSGG